MPFNLFEGLLLCSRAVATGLWRARGESEMHLNDVAAGAVAAGGGTCNTKRPVAIQEQLATSLHGIGATPSGSTVSVTIVMVMTIGDRW